MGYFILFLDCLLVASGCAAIYFMVRRSKQVVVPHPKGGNDSEDDDDGNWEVTGPVDLDLPPGVTLPTDGPKKEPEVAEAV